MRDTGGKMEREKRGIGRPAFSSCWCPSSIRGQHFMTLLVPAVPCPLSFNTSYVKATPPQPQILVILSIPLGFFQSQGWPAASLGY